jgi:hypothetical protein
MAFRAVLAFEQKTPEFGFVGNQFVQREFFRSISAWPRRMR